MNVKIGQHYIDFEGDVCKVLDIKDDMCAVWWISRHPEPTEAELKCNNYNIWTKEEIEFWEFLPLYNSPLYLAMDEDE